VHTHAYMHAGMQAGWQASRYDVCLRRPRKHVHACLQMSAIDAQPALPSGGGAAPHLMRHTHAIRLQCTHTYRTVVSGCKRRRQSCGHASKGGKAAGVLPHLGGLCSSAPWAQQGAGGVGSIRCLRMGAASPSLFPGHIPARTGQISPTRNPPSASL